ncbi:MAG: hypothetical protein ACYCZB_10590 [Acidiphilium sp.]
MPAKSISALLLLGFAFLVAVRMPHIILGGGRFWAEEGVVYFHAAWVKPWYVSWFVVAADAGYINFAAGFGTWLGLHVGGLAYAPLITVLFALAIQCLPVYVIVTHDFPWRKSLAATIAAVLLVAIPPVTGEVWLNTITSQFHLVLTAALIYSAAERRPPWFGIDCAILAFAVLSGPATSFLMPLFVLDALLRRDRQSVLAAAILFIGFAIQLTIFLMHPLPQRGSHLPVAQLLSVISLHTIVLQFAGIDAARHFARYLNARHSDHAILWAGPAIFVGFYAAVAFEIARLRSLVLIRLMLAGLVIVLVSFYEAWAGSFEAFMHIMYSQRYAFAPLVVNALLLTGLAAGMHDRLRLLSAFAVVALLAVGSLDFHRGLTEFRTGPPWQPAVAAWRRNPQKVIALWPGGDWAMSLPARPVPGH